ncbi:TPA: hypothetical protein JG814_004427 [Vibrio parahaemolyticus]|nr:hypothetical protein [Vibrio parahaemolyticus]HAV1348624.1 hypothetical protein [Vibrio parahaemolyticus]HBN6086960.1 hypothetical protein [Vibrio parahaemolyticus]HBN6195523.1 hypothetical protein [Vibrio parahaemolyticus]
MWKITLQLLAMISMTVHAGVLDPECTAEKAAKSTAAKATVGVGGRCSPQEAATDTAKRAAEEALPDEGAAGKAVDMVTPDKEPQPIKNTTKEVIN